MDVQTLFITAALAAGLCGILLLLGSRGAPGIDPLRWWGIAMMLGAAGLVLRVSPGPELLTLDAAKGLLLLTGGVAWIAARAFARQEPVHWSAFAGAALWLVLCRIPEFRASDPAQMAVSCAIGGGYMIVTAYTIQAVGDEMLPSKVPALILLYVHGLLYIARAALAAAELDRDYSNQLTLLLLLEAHVHTIGMAVLLIAMTKERVERDLEISLSHSRAVEDSRARFVAQLSHEVRTPMNSILGVAQLLEQNPGIGRDEQWQVEMLDTAGRHLLAIVNDALDLAKIDAGRLEIDSRPLNPRDTVEECLALVRQRGDDKRLVLGLEVADDVPSLVLGDATRLRQIILNLVLNAVKFTPPGGSVLVRVSHPGVLRVEVVDTGPGVPEEKQSLLFREFSQLQLEDSGTGLGLSLCASLAIRMGGELCYVHRPDHAGSVFLLTLPWVAA